MSILNMMGRRQRVDELESLLAKAQQRVQQLEAEIARDPISGLMPMNRFRAQLDIEVDRARRHGRRLSLAVLDVDGFLAINSRYGFARGDAVLKHIGDILHKATRSHDFTCRTAADEFIFVMPETDESGAVACFQRVLLDLETPSDDSVGSLRTSVGICALQRDQTGPQLIASATGMMSRARMAGGARVMCSGEISAGELDPAEEHQRDAISALAVALLERDQYTGEHSESVTDMVESVARGLGLSEEQIADVLSASLLHDIGKVAIPDSILNKPAKLTDDEFEQMKQHTVIGERILRAVPGLGGAARIVRHEHESWDGSGYPDGLRGSDIPIGSRIILACDAYHAMTSDRPYRKAMPKADAIDELAKYAGSQFDPAVTEILIGHIWSQGGSKSVPAVA